MSLLDLAVSVARKGLSAYFPSVAAVEVAKDLISEAVANKIRSEACARAYEILAQAHRSVMRTIVGQNAVLLLSLLPVYGLRSAWPFYVAYLAVAGHSGYSAAKHWPLLKHLCRSRSITATLSNEVQTALETELMQRQFYERKVVEWLGPDLKKLSDEIAQKLKPDVVAACTSMGVTLVLAFVAFRLFAIPLLEHQALLH